MSVVYATDDEVLAHGFAVRPVWWQRRVPETWSAFLSGLPASEQGRGYRRITRADLFAEGEDASPVGAGRLLVACYAWGTGSSGWLVPRRARVFRDTPEDTLARRLQDARQTLRADGPIAAYATLSDGGRNRIKHMGASFFTKFLYAADPTSSTPTGRALILDRFVAIAINAIHGWELRERGPWSANTYQRWIDHAHREAAKASGADRRVRADAVEMWYFQHGRELVRARSSTR